ncbi:hypothetical protein [Kamptonema formosum]|uniref:hypothetical protein n=1 Tax=Kamptonema formosum TaxID=331992 RepID=UPI0012DD373A|nr:hypothetical protein [Oscillatoria sp. PCC 10802]
MPVTLIPSDLLTFGERGKPDSQIRLITPAIARPNRLYFSSVRIYSAGAPATAHHSPTGNPANHSLNPLPKSHAAAGAIAFLILVRD